VASTADRPPTAPDPLDVLADTLRAIGPATAAVLAAHLGIAYSTITPRLRRLSADHRAARLTDPDTGQNRWQAVAPRTQDTAVDASDVEHTAAGQPAATVTTDTKPQRRAKGSIGADVLRVMRARPANRFKVSELAAALGGTSAGAIANALHKLVIDGTAVQTCEKPASFRAT
jgi:hypothetical protein